MLSISVSQPVVWSPAPGPAVAAVSSAVGVTPVQAATRDGKAGMGQSGRESAAQGQAARVAGGQQERRADTDKAARQGLEAAPLLPRPQPDGRQGQQEAEAEKLEEQKQQAEEAARKLPLQDVIVSAWKASAAVVDVMLGREDAVSAVTAGRAEQTAVAGAQRTEGDAVPALDDVDQAEALADLAEGREVVAYDAQGHSSLAPLEAGSLVSRRV